MSQEFAADDLIAGFGIARDENSIEINRWTLGDHQSDVDFLLRRVNFGNRVDLNKRETLVRVEVRDHCDVFTQPATAENLSAGELDRLEHLLAVLNQIA